MPWSVTNPPRPAKNWSKPARALCAKVANDVLSGGGKEQDAIFACIAAVKKKYPDQIGKNKKADDAVKTTPLTEFFESFYNAEKITLEDGEDGKKKSKLMVFPAGKFQHPWYGELDFTEPVLRKIRANFSKGLPGTEIMVDETHDRGKALGWYKELHVGKRTVDGKDFTGMFADIEWTDLGEEYLKKDIYKYFSPEIGTFNAPDGTKTENVLFGGALTNRPFFKQMPKVKLDEGEIENAFQFGLIGLDSQWVFVEPDDAPAAQHFSEHFEFYDEEDEDEDDDMKLEELLAKINQQFSTELKTEEELVAYLSTNNNNAATVTKLRTKMKEAGITLSDSGDLADEIVSAFTAMKTASDDLSKRVDNISKEFQDERANNAVEPLIKSGRIAPAKKDHYIKLFKSDQQMFTELTKDMPVVVELGERGGNGDVPEPGAAGDEFKEFTEDPKKAAEEVKRYMELVPALEGRK